MRSLGRLVLGSTFILLAAVPVAAQQPNIAAGYGVGAIDFGAFNPGAGAADLALGSGWVVNMFGEGYTGAGHAGLRVNGAFTQRPLDFAGDTRNISTWIMDAGVVLRPFPLVEAQAVSPFVTVGGGFISYGLGRTGRPVVVGEANVFYPGHDERQWLVTAGAGVDILPGGIRVGGTPLGLRLDVADHVALRSPFETLAGERLGPIHNFRFGVSVVGLGWF